MKFCTKCGQENGDDAKFCLGCGEKFTSEENENQTEGATETVTPTNYYDSFDHSNNYVYKGSLGKVSMILGIIAAAIGVLCCCFPLGLPVGIVSVVLGIINLVKHPGHQKGMAIAGIVLGAIAAVFGLYFVLAMPEAMKEIEFIVRQTCEQNPNSDECQAYKEAFPQFFN